LAEVAGYVARFAGSLPGLSKVCTNPNSEIALRMDYKDSMSTIGDLGRRLELEWESRNFAPEDFAALASEALAESGVLSALSLEALTDWALFGPQIPDQKLRDFGQPPINLYAGRGFFIEALIWVDSPTTVHQHGFSGAFGVLKGSSFHSEYAFHPAKCVGGHLMLGSLECRSSEVLRRGDVRPIEAGAGFIHSLVHLEPPSVSIVVRTPRTAAGGPQYNYFLPGLAVDPFYKPEPLATQLELLRATLRTDPHRFESLAGRLVRTRDPWTAVAIGNLAAKHPDEQLFHRLAGGIAESDPELGRALRAMRAIGSAQDELVWLFQQVSDWHGRYLLAALLSGAAPEVLCARIRRDLGTADVAATIAGILEGMSQRHGAVLPLTKVHLKLIELAMRGVPYDELRKNWLERFAATDAQGVAFERAWGEIAASAFLRMLLAVGREDAVRTAVA
jgi:hypothetical protein